MFQISPLFVPEAIMSQFEFPSNYHLQIFHRNQFLLHPSVHSGFPPLELLSLASQLVMVAKWVHMPRLPPLNLPLSFPNTGNHHMALDGPHVVDQLTCR